MMARVASNVALSFDLAFVFPALGTSANVQQPFPRCLPSPI
jgi:hypothetical protein